MRSFGKKIYKKKKKEGSSMYSNIDFQNCYSIGYNQIILAQTWKMRIWRWDNISDFFQLLSDQDINILHNNKYAFTLRNDSYIFKRWKIDILFGKLLWLTNPPHLSFLFNSFMLNLFLQYSILTLNLYRN